MREILFRGKTDDGEWVYGSFCMDAREQFNGLCGVDGFIRLYDKAKGKMQTYEVDRETVGQYTGLKDKNGKRIWEWDILHIAKIADGLGGYYQPPLDYPVNVVVKWDLCAWMWETLCDDKRYITFPDAWCHYEREIIGNIFDNPELLLESKEECNT